MATITLKVPNISCHHCVMTIQREVSPVDGVQKVEGDVEARTVTLAYDGDEDTLGRVKAVLSEIGYPAAE